MARTTLPTTSIPDESGTHYRLWSSVLDDEELQELADRYQHELPARPKSKTGPDCKYDPRFHPRAAFVLTSEHGFTEDQLRAVFGLASTTTLWTWKRKYPKLAQAIQDGRDMFDVCKVERALTRRAIGYDLINREKARVPIYDFVEDANGKPKKTIVGHEMAVVKETVQHIAPDVKAIMFILQNRQPDRWKNVQRFEASGTVRHEHLHAHVPLPNQIVEIDPAQLPTEVLLQLIGTDGADPLMEELENGPGVLEMEQEDYRVAEEYDMEQERRE